jgi:hypothetical protein
MYWAAANDGASTVEFLLHKLHADPNIADDCGRTPLAIATKSGYRNVVHILQGHCDVGASEKELEAGLARRFKKRSTLICDVCQVFILAADFHFHCRICGGGDWDICAECKELGMSCRDKSHQLIKRVTQEDQWVDVA